MEHPTSFTRFTWTINNIKDLNPYTPIIIPYCKGNPTWHCKLMATKTSLKLKFIVTCENNLNASDEIKFAVSVRDKSGTTLGHFERCCNYVNLKKNVITMPQSQMPLWLEQDLILDCRITIVSSSAFKNSMGEDDLERRHNQYANETICDIMKRILRSESGSDVAFYIKGHKIAAHKAVLATHSQVFKQMLTNEMQENLSGIIRIDDISASIFQQLVDYMYTGKIIDDSYNTVASLYYAADKYEMLDLKEWCSQCLLSHISPENCLSILILADSHADVYLFNQVTAFIKFYSQEIVSTDYWRFLLGNNNDIINKYLNAADEIENARLIL